MSVRLEDLEKPFVLLRTLRTLEEKQKWLKDLHGIMQARGRPVDAINMQSYLPMYLRDLAKKKKLPLYVAELADLEWAIQSIVEEDMGDAQMKAKLKNDQAVQAMALHILRFEHEILEWMSRLRSDPESTPDEKREIVTVSVKNDQAVVTKLAADDAVILDELEEGPRSAAEVMQSLERQYVKDSHTAALMRERWKKSFQKLKDASIILTGPTFF